MIPRKIAAKSAYDVFNKVKEHNSEADFALQLEGVVLD